MSALGDPLVDLGILLAYWSPTAPPRAAGRADDGDGSPGLVDARRDPRAICRAIGPGCVGHPVYETFALFKIAVVIQQIFFRYMRGQTDDPRFANFGERVEYLARHAGMLTEVTH